MFPLLHANALLSILLPNFIVIIYSSVHEMSDNEVVWSDLYVWNFLEDCSWYFEELEVSF